MSQYDEQISIEKEQTPVLIVGGSLVGLSMSLFLSWYGIPALVVERHAGISPHPRAAGFNARTLELFRSLGIEQAIREAEPPSVQNSGIMKAENLVGKELDWYTRDVSEAVGDISPVRGSILPQVILEPILQARALELDADIRFNTELVSFEQDVDGVSAVLLDRTTGNKQEVRARYLVAADGYKSQIRHALDIPVHGPGTLSHHISILFQADVREALRGRKIALCMIENPDVQGMMGFSPDGQSGMLFALYYPEKGETPEHFTRARAIELVRAAVGVPHLPVEIASMLPWELAAYIADRFQHNRIFLAGDAAHVMPPVGGFGANTGIQDAHNLAWKLAYVLKGMAGPQLLSTYEVERRPVALFTMEQACARYRDRAPFLGLDDFSAPVIGHQTVVLGYRYHSTAIIPDDHDGNGIYEDPRHPTGCPGTRAPHVALQRGDERISTLDLFGGDCVLLVGEHGDIWSNAANTVSKKLDVDLEVHQIGTDLIDVDQRWYDAYGITSSGAVLVRPDGFIGWRARTSAASSEQTLVQALSCLLSR
jgi:putative polyketide hydroxylase